MESFALVVFDVGPLLQLAIVTTSPSLPYADMEAPIRPKTISDLFHMLKNDADHE